MSPFAVVFLCIQACLVQNVFSYCSSGAGLVSAPVAALTPTVCGAAFGSDAAYGGLGAYGGAFGSAYDGILTPGAAYGGAIAPGAAYGGAGEGNVAVFGELPVAGETALAGQVPISGVVGFRGAVPAAGAVSINGNCACGCSSIY